MSEVEEMLLPGAIDAIDKLLNGYLLDEREDHSLCLGVEHHRAIVAAFYAFDDLRTLRQHLLSQQARP